MVQHGLGPLHPVPGRVPEQLLVVALLQPGVDAIEVADSEVIRGLRVSVTGSFSKDNFLKGFLNFTPT